MKAVFADGILAGHVAFVTGGGTGITGGVARALAEAGASVALVSRQMDHLEPAAAAINEKGGKAFAVTADVRNPGEVENAIAATIQEFGKIDIVVNGAAGNFLCEAAQMSPNGFGSVVDIDLKGTFNVCRAAFPQLKEHRGHILNISATLHYLGTPMQLHVSAAKAGVDALTRNLAVEWGQHGIRVNAIAPGPIEDTEGMKRLVPATYEDFEREAGQGNVVPVVRTVLADLQTPVGAFLRIAGDSPYAFLLESVEGGERIARYSFLGTDPEMIVRGHGPLTFVERNGKREILSVRAVDFVRDYFRERVLARRSGLAPFAGGAVGYLAYDAASWFEPALEKDDELSASETQPLDLPTDALWMFFRNVIAFDRVRQQME